MSANILGSEWNLSPEGLNIVTQSGDIQNAKAVLQNALNADLKVIGKPALAHELPKSRIGKLVLQIQKIRNISAPKAKEESQTAPRMLKLTLTDGESYIQAIEITPINSISREKTAPGTKVLISNASILSGYLLINPQNCTVLGGQVEHLYDKWLLAKSVQQNHQFVSNEGAPPWVPFGHKIISGNQEKPFKSLEKGKESTNDSEFDQLRKDAIAEASTGAVRKTFGGRVRQSVQPAQTSQQFNKGGRYKDREQDRSKRGKATQRDDEVLEKLQRPSEKVSLFSFLEDKLPPTEPKKIGESRTQPLVSNYKQNYQKDTRSQQQTERGNYTRNENKTNRSQQEKSNSMYQKEGRPSNHQNTNSTASKQSDLESVASTTKSLPQKNYMTTNSNVSTRPNDIRNNSSSSSSSRKNAELPSTVNNTPRYSQPNQYKSNNERYSQNVPNSKEFGQPQNQTGHLSNSFRQQQRWDVNDSTNRPISGQPYPHQNSYQQPNTQYNPKTPQQPTFTQNATHSAEMHNLANNLSKMSVSNEFASRSLRQHLNLGPLKRQDVQSGQGTGPNSLNVGDQCMARYWEDGKFYSATVAAITDKTYAVQFTGYGNIEEVLKHDCFSSSTLHNQYTRNQNYSFPQNQFSGTSMEFRSRRGPPRH